MTLNLNPQHISERLWYYEEKKGINLIIEICDESGRLIRTDNVVIPWNKIRKSLKRFDAEDTK